MVDLISSNLNTKFLACSLSLSLIKTLLLVPRIEPLSYGKADLEREMECDVYDWQV